MAITISTTRNVINNPNGSAVISRPAFNNGHEGRLNYLFANHSQSHLHANSHDTIAFHNSHRESLFLESEEETIQRSKKIKIAKDILQKMNINTRRISEAEFRVSFNAIINQADIYIPAIDYEDVLTLAALYCTKSKINPNGPLRGIPTHFFHPENNSEEETQRIKSREQLLAKHCLIDIHGKKIARDMETFKGWHEAFIDTGLTYILKSYSPSEIIELISPGCYKGVDPSVREWLLQTSSKWQGKIGKETAKKACAWVLEVGEKVYDRETDTFDIDAIKKKSWSIVFKNYSLKKMLELCPYTPNIYEAVMLGAEGLGKRKILEQKIKKSDIKTNEMWTTVEQNGEMLIDDITKRLVFEHLPSKGIIVFDKNNRLIRSRVLEFTAWGTEYNAIKTDCLRNSGLNAPQALARVFPDAFGWEGGQIKFWEILHGNIWQGPNKELDFAKAFGYSLHNSGLEGRFDPKSSSPFTFSKRALYEWKQKRRSEGIGWPEHFLSYGLIGGFQEAADTNIIKTFEILLGKVNKKTSCFGNTDISPEDVMDHNFRQTYFIAQLLSDECQRYEYAPISFFPANKELQKSRVYYGLEGTCLEPIITLDNLTKTPRKEKLILYKAVIAAILTTEEKDKTTNSRDRLTALEKILVAKLSQGKEEYLLSQTDLITFLKILSRNGGVIENLNIDRGLKNELTKVLRELIDYGRTTRTIPIREVLLKAIKADLQYGGRANKLSILNFATEYVIGIMLRNSDSEIDQVLESLAIATTFDDENINEKSILDKPFSEERTQEYDDIDFEFTENTNSITIDPETLSIYNNKVEDDPEITVCLLRLAQDERLRAKLLMSDPINELNLIYQIGDLANAGLPINYRYLKLGATISKNPKPKRVSLNDLEETKLLQALSTLRNNVKYFLLKNEI